MEQNIAEFFRCVTGYLPYPLVLLGRPFLRIGMSAADGELFTLVSGQSCFETSVEPVCGKTVEFHPLFDNDGWS